MPNPVSYDVIVIGGGAAGVGAAVGGGQRFVGFLFGAGACCTKKGAVACRVEGESVGAGAVSQRDKSV